jgi:hypothetical protein
MLEDDLRAALRPVDPPEGFEHRVLARIEQQKSAVAVTPRRFPAWAAAAGLAFASLAGVAVYHDRQVKERERGMAARDQLVLALQITGKKLDTVRNQINYSDSNNKNVEQEH